MEKEKQFDDKKKANLLIIGFVLLLAIIVTIVLAMPRGTKSPELDTPDDSQLSDLDIVYIDEEPNSILEGALSYAPGANLVTTDGIVVDDQGNEVRIDAPYNSPEAPRRTQAIRNLDSIKDGVLLTIGDNRFTPDRFSVEAGDAITIALTNNSEGSHDLVFEDKVLQGVVLNIPPGETRAVTFNAPDEKGDYAFYCGMPGHKGKGETGVMTVK